MCRNNSINKNNNNNDSIQYEVPNRNNIIKNILPFMAKHSVHQ